MNDQKTILAITKTEGSGARSVADELVRLHGYKLYSIRDYLRTVFGRLYKKPSTHQEELKVLANNIRKERGVERIVKYIFQCILKDTDNTLFIIESLLCPGEIEYLIAECKKYGIRLKIAGIDAPYEMRFERLKKRLDSKGVKDLIRLKEMEEITPAEYLARRRQMYTPIIAAQVFETEQSEAFEKDPAKTNVPKCFSLYVKRGKRFQNLDGKLSCAVQKLHQFVMAV
jgi:dephospho-CoA kinase